MTEQELLNKGYFPKELPPCFFTELVANNIKTISQVMTNTEVASKVAFENKANGLTGLTTAQLAEEKVRLRQIFKNRLSFSDCVQFSIPKAGIARNLIKIPNPLHQSKLATVIATNYNQIETLFKKSQFSTTKPEPEPETGEGKRSVKHNNFAYFKEQCIVNSFQFPIELKADIASFYPSIYTHSVPWVTFGGKDKYKRNRDLHLNDGTKIKNIYGDDIDDRLMWCQNQQTVGIPIGPDTSFIIAEIIGCHIDELLEKSLRKKKTNYIAYRYYDDFALYFNSELDAQVALAELKSILHDFELRINDSKTKIAETSSELESEWALSLKSFYFRPSEEDQKEDLWNYFSLAFRYASLYPNDSVLRLSINKFKFVRIEKENWAFFEALIYRLGFADTGSLQFIAKLLISYKSFVNKTRLKDFCSQLVIRNYENKNDYELTWALWLLKEFKLQPTKKIFELALKSQSVTASIIALDLLTGNPFIKTFDYTIVERLITTESLNTRNWLICYETIFHDWLGLAPSIVSDHFFFNILRTNNVHFYDSTRTLEPFKTDRSYLKKIAAKITQIEEYLLRNQLSEKHIQGKVNLLTKNLKTSSLAKMTDRNQMYKTLTDSENAIKSLIEELRQAQAELKEFDKKKPYFVVQKRLEELQNFTSKEIEAEAKQDKELLFDPKYD